MSITATELSHLVRQVYPRADHCFTDLLRASHTARLSLSDALATVEAETGFTNVFGHDPVRNPVKGGRVTRARYLYYRVCRRRGMGMQGVGYTQLTWYTYQDQADKLGGCWRPYPNMVVGFRLMRELIAQHGRTHGAARFNGVGDAADAYGRRHSERQEFWHRRLQTIEGG